MYICICKNVTEQEIRDAVDEIRDAVDEGEIVCLEDLSKLQVAQNCGSCLCMAQEILEDEFSPQR
jgi:bacterioferritin-associated ferredoxin